MSTFPKNHDEIYFDKLCRKYKSETVLSLIFAAYSASLVEPLDDEKYKLELKNRLYHAYELFRIEGAGTYGGDPTKLDKQFSSQYTIGHEMNIWKAKSLRLNDFAKKVAKFEITIKDYFDVFFLNYVQPVNESNVHILYRILNYMNVNNSKIIKKDEIPLALEVKCNTENAKSVFYFLKGTSFFKDNDETLEYSSNISIPVLMNCCNLTYVGKEGYEKTKSETVFTEEDYEKYLFMRAEDSNGNKQIYGNNQSDIKGENIILYGVPGAGKSHTVEEEYCGNEMLMERVVFHPEYTYSDFIGQIMPVVTEDNRIQYKFVPGPFTTILERANRIENKNKHFYLVIEEINRGNAPAIFGDVFQLLDRDKNGDSKYGITNSEIAKIIYNDCSHKIRIPRNLSIIATMNTSDQNVFTLDTAFQRRWHMRLIANDFSQDKDLSNTCILDTKLTWEDFCTIINEHILRSSFSGSSLEDRRLGTHFISKEDLLVSEKPEQVRRFPEKVIKYLWDDAFKSDREACFNLHDYNSLEKIVKQFCDAKTTEDRFKIFNKNIVEEINNMIQKEAEEVGNEPATGNDING